MDRYETDFTIYNNLPYWAIPPKGMAHHNGDHLGRWIEGGRFYEAHILNVFKKYIPDSGVFIDIGANIGNHSLMFTQLFDDVELYAFEASPYNFIYLYQNVLGHENINPYCIGLSDVNELVKFSHYEEDYGSSGVSSVNDNEKENMEKVFEMNIMLYEFDKLPIDISPDFIKLDVENYEIQVLNGMMDTISNSNPMIWLEDHPLEQNKNLEKSPTKHLEKFGYEPIAMCECNVLLEKN